MENHQNIKTISKKIVNIMTTCSWARLKAKDNFLFSLNWGFNSGAESEKSSILLNPEPSSHKFFTKYAIFNTKSCNLFMNL